MISPRIESAAMASVWLLFSWFTSSVTFSPAEAIAKAHSTRERPVQNEVASMLRNASQDVPVDENRRPAHSEDVTWDSLQGAVIMHLGIYSLMISLREVSARRKLSRTKRYCCHAAQGPAMVLYVAVVYSQLLRVWHQSTIPQGQTLTTRKGKTGTNKEMHVANNACTRGDVDTKDLC